MSAPTRRLRVEEVMGTVVTVDVRPPLCDESVLDEVVGWFHTVDERFSTFREDSEVSRLSRGEMTVGQVHGDVREVLDLCALVRERSGGAFDERRGTVLDPAAVVKGWSVDRAVALLEEAGARNLCVNAGGDVVVRGGAGAEGTWRVGIRHPGRADRVVAVLAVTDLAVATSGAYERGDHVVDPRTGGQATGVRSMTVVGPSLALADAYSTAAYVMGRDGPAWVTAQPGFGVLAVTDDDRTVYDDTVAALLVRPPG